MIPETDSVNEDDTKWIDSMYNRPSVPVAHMFMGRQALPDSAFPYSSQSGVATDSR